MRRADRLFEIIQLIRRFKVTTARKLADRLEVSERTIYRDISDLVARGVPIIGEAGIGYSLGVGYDLPPLMFTEDELAALLFGARIVQNWTDSEMARSVNSAVAKIHVVIPRPLQRVVTDVSLWSPPASKQQAPLSFDLVRLRSAVRARHKLRFDYRDEHGAETRRTVHPLMLCFYGTFWLLGGWCELRNDFRFFQLDRMREVQFLDESFPAQPGRTAEDLLRQQINNNTPDATLSAGHCYARASIVPPRRPREACGKMTQANKIEISDLASFLRLANQRTYANKNAPQVQSTRLGSQDYEFDDGDLRYHDTFFGDRDFIGEEIVYRRGKLFWGMNYFGFILADELKETEVYDFLRIALMQQNDDIIPVRGRPPSLTENGSTPYR